jgi:predicted SprT family Zn-dependent metalloprotease
LLSKYHASVLSLFDDLRDDLSTIALEALQDGAACLRMKEVPTVEWRNYSVTAGRAYMKDNLICLSRPLLDSPSKVRETVLHELAHIYVYRKHGTKARPHGREWRQAMQRLGLSPNVYHNYACERKSRQPKFFLECKACGASFGRIRPLKRNRIYLHVGCGGLLHKKEKEAK